MAVSATPSKLFTQNIGNMVVVLAIALLAIYLVNNYSQISSLVAPRKKANNEAAA